MTRAHLVLADGTHFEGIAIGAEGETVGEVVFTTGMTGYQEVLTDPSYCGQIVTMTAPQMGNTGVNDEDPEAEAPAVAGFVVHELARRASNWRMTETLEAYLARHGIVAIAGIDTRALTRHIRDHGAQMAAIGTGELEALKEKARTAPPMTGRDLTGEVTAKAPYEWTEGTGRWGEEPAKEKRFRVVAYDLGIKRNILRCLVDAGCEVTVVPSSTSAEDILAREPDGVFLSNGPGDPAAVGHAIETVKGLVGKKPLFGICLGHQLLSLALGASTYKLKFGHRGLNQPVKDLATGRIEITTQNHGFAVDPKSLPDAAELTHVHLNDNTCMGIAAPSLDAFSVQYHPEAAAGPHDSRYLFERFTDAMEKRG
ncbi:MAG TPA: glutamine-hydrolyzing carbamoyl-phosphate synthase small subunit [Polyangiaceae bacterium LLY-WYZ-15_(1-7)]|nr:carbamoyl phosphate synthase small subunit [Sandaracinus sp.]HJL06322.1 glutamine-hydrolyzing carbamoyl-phosphate synthase small subunit [Polyangiaceae bacterium LLY-WYZ-15_(1-7)]HJL10783.1 glutamine-hydrolyzing carbamoyl-phosphate synthase small subunit [Polyangiaceae bacterium LLY-WYZ-15_(1-7)]HJL20969.1 glutamine-hydrolyzing carbamoyl-phosphate synthase small subunit [Polyangiaceae bacterium LLY-WYZ-15_(1-7)]HJL30345.1 glutamine-hydrolyzing carbamoyl-phosphate synthase small subunit [Poly